MNKLNLANNYIPESGARHLNQKGICSGMLYSPNIFSKKIINKTNIKSLSLDGSGYSRFENKVSFKEIIAQNFRSDDLVILNNFSDSLFLKKKLFNNLFGIAGLPIDIEGINGHTSDRIAQNSNLLLKTNALNSPKFLYKKFVKNIFVKNLGMRCLNENLIQRPDLFSKKRFRKKIHELMYFDNNKKKIVKRQRFRRLFLNMSNKIRGLDSVVVDKASSSSYSSNIQKKSILNSRINDNSLLEKNKLNSIISSLTSRSFKRYLFKLRHIS